MTDSPVLALAKDLISRESVTPEDADCQKVMIERLEKLGFEIEVMVFEDTTNFWLAKAVKRRYSPLLAIPMLYQLDQENNGIPHHLNQQSLMVIFMDVVQQI